MSHCCHQRWVTALWLAQVGGLGLESEKGIRSLSIAIVVHDSTDLTGMRR